MVTKVIATTISRVLRGDNRIIRVHSQVINPDNSRVRSRALTILLLLCNLPTKIAGLKPSKISFICDACSIQILIILLSSAISSRSAVLPPKQIRERPIKIRITIGTRTTRTSMIKVVATIFNTPRRR
jgi:hypothetical protein